MDLCRRNGGKEDIIITYFKKQREIANIKNKALRAKLLAPQIKRVRPLLQKIQLSLEEKLGQLEKEFYKANKKFSAKPLNYKYMTDIKLLQLYQLQLQWTLSAFIIV